ncbi:MAG TPA: cytochrome c3 family protein [Bacteroidales bacterium]|nr:cytochrome c3 family protein [Bacteroidales bacterium]
MTKICQQHGTSAFRRCYFPWIKKTGTFILVLIFLLPISFVSATDEEGADGHDSHYSQSAKRGERLFYGLVEGKFEGNACADCHNTMEIDTFNWNPNAWEIAHKYKDKSAEAFTKVVLNPTGRTMSATHASFNLNEAEVELIKEFLDHFEEEGLSKQKPIINKILLFFVLGAILTWIVLDVVFLKRVKRKWILGLLFLGALGWQVQLLLDAGIALGRQENYEPDQPVKFSHAVHVTDNLIDCQYCHHTVEHSKSANIPEVELCMNCHIIVREGTNSGRHEISKLVEAYESGNSIEWIRIHNLQDHAFFSHAQHVKVGEIECQTCHGPIEDMHRVSQVSDLSMGWCINCHRDTEVQFFDNAFYDKYEALHQKVKSGEIDRITSANTGGTECSKCHY